MRSGTTHSNIEYRTSFDFRATDDVAGFEGHAASWWSIDAYGTAMQPGAFKKTVNERRDRIPVLWNHNPDWPVGKHLDIHEDDHGLYVNIGIADDGAEGSVLLKRLRFGVPLGMSFGFQTIKSRPATEDDPLDWSHAPKWLGTGDEALANVIVITETAYWESSPVTFPANEDSTIDAIRSAHLEQEAEFLTTITDDLRAGRIADGDARHSLLDQLVAAYQARAGAGPAGTTPLVTPEPRRRNRYAEAALLFGELGISL